MNCFNYLRRNFNILDCDTIKLEIVVNKFSIPIFTTDKKTALLIYTDKINNTGCESYHVDLYKKDENGNWMFLKQMSGMETD